MTDKNTITNTSPSFGVTDAFLSNRRPQTIVDTFPREHPVYADVRYRCDIPKIASRVEVVVTLPGFDLTETTLDKLLASLGSVDGSLSPSEVTVKFSAWGSYDDDPYERDCRAEFYYTRAETDTEYNQRTEYLKAKAAGEEMESARKAEEKEKRDRADYQRLKNKFEAKT